MLIGGVAVRSGVSLFSGGAPRRDVGIFVLSTLTLAAAGCFIAAAQIARRDKKYSWVAVWLSVAAAGAWSFILYAVISGWLD
jgi:hypothetical protein